MEKRKATIIGLLAILFWSTMVGLIRAISEEMGPVGGAATVYTASSLLMLVTSGWPKIRTVSRTYLYLGSLLFVSYEVFFALSLGYANTSRQAVEVAMLNYLWPSLTVLFVILFNKQKANFLIVPGLLLAFLGVCWVVGGDRGLDVSGMWLNIQDNPISYFLAFTASILWASYCTLTIRVAKGRFGVTLFLMLTALTLWVQYFLTDNPPIHFDVKTAAYLCMSAVSVGFGYAAWNIGIVYGNVTLLATASYFTPILSSALAALLLSIPLSMSFWSGAILVCTGSLLCWLSTRTRT